MYLQIFSAFAALLAFVGQENTAAGLAPCQPYMDNTTLLCTEFQALLNNNLTSNTVCNKKPFSCAPKAGTHSRSQHGPCYCDSICKELGDCCVDYDTWLDPNKTTELDAPANVSCKQVPSDNTGSLLGYVMVTSCPASWVDMETQRACLSANYSVDPTSALPAVDMTTNLTYANIHCAMCHGKSRNLRLWNLRIYWSSSTRELSIASIRSPQALWEASPFMDKFQDKCITTPKVAKEGNDTRLKQFCRSYVNGIKVIDGPLPHTSYKNIHCAMLLGYNVSRQLRILCDYFVRRPPLLRSMLFTFSSDDYPTERNRLNTRETRIRIDYNCQVNEVYDPFQGRCLRVIATIKNRTANTSLKDAPDSSKGGNPEKCVGPLFSSNEFQILGNHSAFVFPQQMIYSNQSYVLKNHTLILCANFSRNYTKHFPKTPEQKKSFHSPAALVIITYVGFSLSIISLLFLLVTYLLFKELRTYPGKKVMHLSCAMIAFQTVYFLSDPDVVSSAVCVVMAALIHYLILVVFLWMSVIAYNTQKTFSRTTLDLGHNMLVNSKRKSVYLQNCLFSWGMPVAAVGVCVTLQLSRTGNVAYGDDDGCQLSLPARMFAVAIPVSLMLLFNVGALIRTAIAIKRNGRGNMASTNQRSLPLIVLKMTSLMGGTWILGFVLAFYQTPYLEYPFTILNSCQGVFICLSFVCRKRVFVLYKEKLCPPRETDVSANGNYLRTG